MRTIAKPIALLCLSLCGISAFASTGEDEAIVRYCGAPISQDKRQSPATDEFTENYFYPDGVVMHFVPVDGGWQLTSAWMRHIPVTREGLAERMPCVKDALAEAAQAPKRQIDPTIAAQTVQSEARRSFGIPFLWLIFFLILTLLIAVVIPTPRKRTLDLPIPRAPRREPEVVVQERIRQSSASHQKAVE